MSLDSAVAGFPVAGEPTTLLLAVRPGPDSVDVRAVVRYDSLPARYFPPGGGDSVLITRRRQRAPDARLDTGRHRASPSR